MPLEVPPPRSFGSPLILSRVHWVRPELIVEVKYLAGTGDNILCQVAMKVYAITSRQTEVRCEVPDPQARNTK
jgi:bifunctional non-homologous end joining protein LigD